MADIILCKNLGATPLRVTFNSKSTTITPGSQGFLDREAAIVHFGNWEARNWQKLDGTWSYDRREELRRLKGLAGCDAEGRAALEHADVWEARRPKVELATQDGQKIVLIWDDPDGNSLVEDTKPDVAAQMAWLQSQIENLRDQLDEANAAPPIDIPEDTPETAVRRRGRVPQAQSAEAM